MRILLFLILACQNPDSTQTEPPKDPVVEVPSDAQLDGAHFILNFSERNTQYLKVRAVFPTHGQDTLSLAMATWTPGSYLIREYSRHVEGMTATANGKRLEVTKSAKNQWDINAKGLQAVNINYMVYAHELTVRGNWVEQDFAVLNGAPTFLSDRNHTQQPYFITIEAPIGWTGIHTALPQQNERFFAADYDTLVDSPWLFGQTHSYDFTVNNTPHTLVNWGEDSVWDGEKAAKDVEKITKTTAQFWGSIPYTHYLFLNVIGEGGGGLEHKNSTLMMTSRWKTHERESYLDWLGLVSHEFFHTWNGKRLRPEPLGPFDYYNENYTRSLWIVEGLTSYYDDLLLVRAGLMNDGEYRQRLSKQINKLQNRPGRKTRSLEEVSFDAWLKHYRSDENSLNTAISYYTKGAVVGWLLDMQIREHTKGKASLDDVMRKAYSRFSKESGFRPEDFQSIAEEVAGTDLNPFFEDAVRGTTELDYTKALAWTGMSFHDSKDSKELWLGLKAQSGGGGVRIDSVHKGSPAFEGNLISGDVVLAINGFRVRSHSQLTTRLNQLSNENEVVLLVSRRGKVSEVRIESTKSTSVSRKLILDKTAGKAASRQREHWLNGTRP